MDAILLVGGFGTRLLPLTKSVPKPLIPLVNVPFLERTIGWLGAHGIDHVVMSLHYSAELFIDYFRNHASGVDISFAVEDEPLGTGGAIKNCDPYLRSPRCFVCNGDIFTTLPLREMLDDHGRVGAAVSIALKEVEDPSRYGVIETNPEGRILTFTEKPTREEARSRDINAGIYIFNREVLAHFPAGACSVERQVFPDLLARGMHLHGFRGPCYWTDLGTPDDYLQAHRDILAGRVALPLGFAERRPGIWCGADAQIAADARLIPPVVLGAGVRIAPGAVVGPSAVLGAGVVVETGAQVEDSILWEHTHVAARSRIRGSILGRAVRAAGQVYARVCEDDLDLSG